MDEMKKVQVFCFIQGILKHTLNQKTELFQFSQSDWHLHYKHPGISMMIPQAKLSKC